MHSYHFAWYKTLCIYCLNIVLYWDLFCVTQSVHKILVKHLWSSCTICSYLAFVTFVFLIDFYSETDFLVLSILSNSRKKVGRKVFSYVYDKFALLKTHVFEHQTLKIIRTLWTEDSCYFCLWISKFYKGWHSERVLFVCLLCF